MFENVPQCYSENPNILRWWTNELDELLVQLIDRHAWYWPWFAQEAICHVVEEETIERCEPRILCASNTLGTTF